MSAKCYLAIDLGAASGRLLAGVLENGRIDVRELHRFWNGPVEENNEMHWDLDTLLSEIKTGLKTAFDTYGGSIQSLGIDSWGVDYGLIDADGALINAPFHYRSNRTKGKMDEVFQCISKEELFLRTGVQPMPINTIFQLAAEKSRPEFKKAAQLLFIPNLVSYMLTGNAITEYTIASTSQLLDVHKRTWDKELIKKLELPEHIFGEIVEPGTVIGALKDEIADEVGGNVDVIAVGSHDTASAIAATPLPSKHCAYLSSGTWSLMGIETPTPIVDKKISQLEMANEGGVCNTICFLKNICGLWLIQECRRIWNEEGTELGFGIGYNDISKEAIDSEPFIAFIFPDAPEFINPENMPDAVQSFCKRTGQRVPEGPGQISRVVFDSLAMRYREVFASLEKLQDQPLEQLHIVGGGSKNILLNRLTADALNRPVVFGPVEATATGNMLIQMLSQGEIKTLSEGRNLVHNSLSIQTIMPESAELWDDAFERYMAIRNEVDSASTSE